MNIVIAIDLFKSSFTTLQAGNAAAAGCSTFCPFCRYRPEMGE